MRSSTRPACTSGPARVANNVFYGNGAGLILSGAGDTVLVRNNVMRWNGAGFTGGHTGHDIDYNVVWEESVPESMRWPESYYGDHDLFIDPGLEDPAAGDFRLKAGSPLIDGGDPEPWYDDSDGSRNDIGTFGGPDGSWSP